MKIEKNKQPVKPDPGKRSCNIMDEEKNEREHDATELERRRGAHILVHHHPPTAALSLTSTFVRCCNSTTIDGSKSKK